MMFMLDLLRDGVSWVAILVGVGFVLIGAVGVLRLPDFYTRLHAAGMTDTMGAELVLFGLMLQSDSIQTVLKLALIALFLFITSPTATHAVANAAYRADVKPLLGRGRPSDEDDENEGAVT